MSRASGPVRRRATRRAGSLASRLGGEIDLLLDGRAAGAPTELRRQVRATVGGIDAALSAGLGYDLLPDPDLGHLRAHARNLAVVIRRSVEAALGAGTEPEARSRHLGKAARFADELSQTLRTIQQRLPEVEAPAPDRSWSGTWTCRLLLAAATLLPSEQRRDFVEDQCGNLGSAESRGERARYLLGLLARMPAIAAAALAARDRERREGTGVAGT